jgi:hypothetical protein
MQASEPRALYAAVSHPSNYEPIFSLGLRSQLTRRTNHNARPLVLNPTKVRPATAAGILQRPDGAVRLGGFLVQGDQFQLIADVTAVSDRGRDLETVGWLLTGAARAGDLVVDDVRSGWAVVRRTVLDARTMAASVVDKKKKRQRIKQEYVRLLGR